MQTYLYYFFEYLVFFLVLFPLINEFIFTTYPKIVIELHALKKQDINAARSSFMGHLTGASFAVCVGGLFTSQGFLFWMYFFMGILPNFLELKWKDLRTRAWFVRLDGAICLTILITILICRFYYNESFMNVLVQLYIGPEPLPIKLEQLRAS